MEQWYLAGRMSGLEANNYPAFFEWAARLQADGYKIINPAALVGPTPARTHAECMEICAPFLVHTDTVGCFVLPSPTPHAWTRSTGGCWEVYTTLLLGRPVLDCETRAPIAESYSYQGPMFTPIRRLTGMADGVATTAMAGTYSMMGTDAPDDLGVGICGNRERRAG